jgi:deoxyribodipyrimidine photo-lyase
MTVLVWFKRDLRIRDNAVLLRAQEISQEKSVPLLPLYIVEPEYWSLPDTSGRHWEFISQSLKELRNDLGSLGAPLIVREGDAKTILENLHSTYNITTLFSHEEIGNNWTYQRDKTISQFSKNNSIQWVEIAHTPVIRGLKTESEWTQAREKFLTTQTISMPHYLRGISNIDIGRIPTKSNLNLVDPCPGLQAPGRRAGVNIYTSFLKHRGQYFKSAVSSPLRAEKESSRISPHLAYGTLSMREIYRGLKGRADQNPGQQWISSLMSFESRVQNRDGFMQQFESNSWIEHDTINIHANTLRPRNYKEELLHAWETGETGYPFVDACMRYLNHTGWLNFRMRAMVLSFASYQLWLDWRDTGPILARLFTDYEPGIHWPMVQMQSGTNQNSVPRIYNPVKQGYDQDPSGIFTRTWCPELKNIPDIYLQEPWKSKDIQNTLKNTYPHPIVDLASSTQIAKELSFAAHKNIKTKKGNQLSLDFTS